MDVYTPERVAGLAERLRQIAESQRMDFDSPHVGMTLDESADALTAVSAERDRLHKAITEALAFESVLPAIATEPRRILRAALDKGRNDDE